ncbi:MAG: site-specific DNA-methyltransferase, partial [Candidatus Hydrothermales bacterium]
GDCRKMIELQDETIDLIVTSPPYWNLKDYNVENQIGFNQSLHDYLKDLFIVWAECFRVLRAGARLCVNVGDIFLRTSIYGFHKIVPIHAEIVIQAEKIGFDYMGAIIWQKRTNKRTTGGSSFMGSYPYPSNGMIEIDYEFILIFKKCGKSKKVSQEIKKQSGLTKEEWRDYFNGHWAIPGVKQRGHCAMFPLEIPLRLIKMFSFVGDVVLDPFLGSGTTLQAAYILKRNGIGYEINKNYLNLIQEKLKNVEKLEIIERKSDKFIIENKFINYEPYIKNINIIF